MMRKFMITGVGAGLAAVLALGPAFAADNAPPQPRRSVDPLQHVGPVLPEDNQPPELKDYEHTGQFQPCIPATSVRELVALNHEQILVRTHSTYAYLADVKTCPNLNRGITIAYDATPGLLCNTTILHLLDPGTPAGVSRGTCGVMRFERMEKLKK
jgi:hypothetical protein